MNSVLSESDLSRAASLRDLTDAEHGAHAIQCLVEDVEIALRNVWRCALLRHRAPRFADGVPRDSMTSALAAAVGRVDPAFTDALISCPGIVFPAVSSGRGEPSHELALLRVRAGRRLSTESVDVMAHTVSTTLLPDLARLTPDSAAALCTDALELQVGTSRGLVRIGEAGVLTNEALASLRLDPIRFSAILLRLDLDRVLMLRKGIDDVKLLRSEDPLVKRQLLELGRFRNICEMSA